MKSKNTKPNSKCPAVFAWQLFSFMSFPHVCVFISVPLSVSLCVSLHVISCAPSCGSSTAALRRVHTGRGSGVQRGARRSRTPPFSLINWSVHIGCEAPRTGLTLQRWFYFFGSPRASRQKTHWKSILNNINDIVNDINDQMCFTYLDFSWSFNFPEFFPHVMTFLHLPIKYKHTSRQTEREREG